MTPEEYNAAMRRREVDQFQDRLAQKIADEEDDLARRRIRELFEVSPSMARKCSVWFFIMVALFGLIMWYVFYNFR
jgi:hypothetical protein